MAKNNPKPGDTKRGKSGDTYTMQSDGTWQNNRTGKSYDLNNGKFHYNSEATHANESIGSTHRTSSGDTVTKVGNGVYESSYGGNLYYYGGGYHTVPQGANATTTAGSSLGSSGSTSFTASNDFYSSSGYGSGYFTDPGRAEYFGIGAVVTSTSHSGKATASELGKNYSAAELSSMADSNGNITVVSKDPNTGKEWKQTINISDIPTRNFDPSTPPPSNGGGGGYTPPTPPSPGPTPTPTPTPSYTQTTSTIDGSTRSEVSKKVTDVKTVDNVSTTMSNEVIGWNLPAMDEIIKRFKEISKNFADAELNCKELIPKINEAWSSTYGSVAYDAKLKDGMLKHFAEGADAMDKICGVLEAVETIYREFETKVLAGEYTGDYSEVNGFTVKYSGEAYTNNMTNVLEHKQVIDTTTTTYNTAATTVTSTYCNGTLVNQSTSGGGTTSSTSTSSETVNVNDVGTKTGGSVVDAAVKEALLKDSYNKQIYDILVSKGLSDANALAAVKGYSEILAKTGEGKSVYTLDYVHAENNAKVTKTMRFLTDKTTGQVKLLNIDEKTDKTTTITTSSTTSDGSTVPDAPVLNSVAPTARSQDAAKKMGTTNNSATTADITGTTTKTGETVVSRATTSASAINGTKLNNVSTYATKTGSTAVRNSSTYANNHISSNGKTTNSAEMLGTAMSTNKGTSASTRYTTNNMGNTATGSKVSGQYVQVNGLSNVYTKNRTYSSNGAYTVARNSAKRIG